MAGVTGLRRARSPQDKERRRQDILDRAWELFQTRPWAELTMSDVADASHLSKAALYRYFETKEALFLEVEAARLGSWLYDLGADRERLPRPASPDAVATLFADSLAARPGLPRLLSLLHVSLEQNVPFDAALAFKRALHDWLVRLGSQLEVALGSLPAGAGLGAALQLHALCIGLWQMSDSGPVVKRLLERQELRPLRVDFHAALVTGAATLLRGIIRTERPAKDAGRQA
ncbi:MAG TPA: TetR family transcriptional regulator [Myxococcaceae bacterium]